MASKTSILSPAQYLEDERKRVEKYEYEDGNLVSMGGATKIHNRIVRNILTYLWTILKARGGFEAYASDMRVHSPADGKYYYPDVLITQGPEEYLDEVMDTLLNPSLIIEVLSSHTEARDRGIKFEAYRSIPTLREYLLVAQDTYCIEGFFRDESGQWVINDPVYGLESSYSFHHFPLELPLREAYFNVKLS